MSEFETSHRLHFLFCYKTKCKFQFEIEKVAKNKSSLPKMGCFEVKRLTLLATFTLKQPVLGREWSVYIWVNQYSINEEMKNMQFLKI